MNLKGTIKSIGDVHHVSDRFKKQEMVLNTEINTPYPQTILVEFQQDKCELLSNYKEGDEVSIEANLKGRQWTDSNGVVKTFNTISAWRIELISSGSQTNNEGHDANTTFTPNPIDNNDLLF